MTSTDEVDLGPELVFLVLDGDGEIKKSLFHFGQACDLAREIHGAVVRLPLWIDYRREAEGTAT